MKLVYENSRGQAQYEASSKTLYTQYVGLAHADIIIDLLEKVLPFSEEHSINHMIANLANMQGTFTGAMDFFEKRFYPTMIKNGLRTYAMVVPPDVFTKFAADSLQKTVGGKLDWRMFPSFEAAQEWTDSQVK